MLVNGVLINRAVLSRFLQRLPGETPETVDKLLNPNDHQNVPIAVGLLESIVSLRTLDPTAFTDPADRIAFKALLILSELWDAFLEAFLSEEDSLSEQLASLSKFAHLTYALYIYHNSAFMSNQLYSDSQALVKAAFVCVGRQQDLDPLLPFFLFLLGSDRLEQLFAEVRTQSHDRNCDILQLCARLGISADMVATLNRYPKWDRGHRRRSFRSNGGIDHVNPSHYKGDLIAGHVNLQWSWDEGRRRTENILQKAGIPMDILYSLSRFGGDFMKPNGSTYPGSCTDPDRSVSEDRDCVGSNGCADTEPAASDGASHPNREMVQVDEHELRNLLSSAVESERPLEISQGLPPSDPPAYDAQSAAVQLDWIYVPREDGSDPLSVYKETLLRLWFNEGIDSTLSMDRPRRVRGFSKYGYLPVSVPSENPTVTRLAQALLPSSHDHTLPSAEPEVLDPSTSLDLSSTLFLEDVAIVPIRSADTISLAFIKITDIEVLGRKVTEVSLEDLGKHEEKVFIHGQVFAMQRELIPTAGDDRCFWLWTGEYVRFSPISGRHSDAEHGMKSAYIVRTPGHLVVPAAECMEASSLLPVEHRKVLNQARMPLTYAISDGCLDSILCDTYSSKEISPVSLVSSLPKHGAASNFPYLDSSGGMKIYCYL